MTEAPAMNTLIGTSRPLSAWTQHARGRTRYAADEVIDGLLHARLVLSSEAHARIVGVDRDAALAVPGVVAVLTAADLPLVGTDDMRMDQPLATEEAVFAGQPIAVVVAESVAAADDGARLVAVELEPLPAVVDPVAAMAPDSPIARPRTVAAESGNLSSLHAAVGGDDSGSTDAEEQAWSENVSGHARHREGDIEAVLGACAVRRQATFRTGWVYQAYLEPQVATAIPTPDGRLELRTAAQGTEYVREQLARILGRPIGTIDVTGTPLGGAFGGKVLIVEPIVAAVAAAIDRPVRLVLTRSDDMAMTNPVQAMTIEAEVGADADGRLRALRARIVGDAGAFSEWSVHGVAAVLIGGTYRWDAVDIEAFGVETNRFGTGSYRAPGGPPAAYAIESLIDEIAEATRQDAADVRRRSLVATGDPMVDGVAWPTIGAAETLDRLAGHELWQERSQLPDGQGVGLALGVWPGGKSPASAACRLEVDGTLTLTTAMVDMAGTTGSIGTIAAEAFGLAPDAVRLQILPAGSGPETPLSGGSTITYSLGRAVKLAAEAARERFLELAAEHLEIGVADLELADGIVTPRGAPSRAVSVAELVAAFDSALGNREPIEGHGPVGAPALAPAVAGHLVRVAVDRATGSVTVLDHVVAQDVGRAIDPALIEGQMRGAAAQALGWALSEEILFGAGGELLTGSLLDYDVPRADMVAPVECLIVEVPAPDGPFGARGVGEPAVVAGAAAVANAVAAATGVRQRRLPITPARLWASLHEGGA